MGFPDAIEQLSNGDGGNEHLRGFGEASLDRFVAGEKSDEDVGVQQVFTIHQR